MILMCHPRSGSEFLLRGLDLPYSQYEILGTMQYANVPLSKKIAYLKTLEGAQKIHGFQLRAVMGETLAPVLIDSIRAHKLYFLEREDKRKSMVSEWIAVRNGMNYHADPKDLTRSGRMVYSEFWALYQSHVMDTLWISAAFPYVERFTYEGLLAGEQPRTLQFDIAKGNALTTRRNSWELGLIQNIDQVNRWMDELQVPGTLS